MGRWPASEFLITTNSWRKSFPGAHAGVLAMSGVRNPASSAELENLKRRLEANLRQRFKGMDRTALKAHPVLAAYDDYYKRFGKTYHVQLQLESIVLKGKTIPSSAALVESMFMAEMDNLLLTAGHDLDTIRLPLALDVARGTETYTLLRGSAQTPKAGDMMISDSDGILSTILYGPDQRTHFRPETTRSVFTVYSPEGIDPDAVEAHLKAIAHHAQLIAPEASVELLKVYSAQ